MPKELEAFRTEDGHRLHGSWYRGAHCNYYPRDESQKVLDDGLYRYVLKGWVPEAPFIGKDNFITAFGSCFAVHITKHLRECGYAVGLPAVKGGESHVVLYGSGIVNTFALCQQFEWAYEGRRFNERLWFNSEGELAEASDQIRDETRAIFDRTDVFILTLGLSEVWYSKATGHVFWRAIPQGVFDESQHGFRLSTVDENLNNLLRIYTILRKHRPSAAVILSLSPIPLAATFRPVGCVTADSVSKAILRVAVDELMRMCNGGEDADGKLFYWPSYEIINDWLGRPFKEGDLRHLQPDATRFVVENFERWFCTG